MPPAVFKTVVPRGLLRWGVGSIPMRFRHLSEKTRLFSILWGRAEFPQLLVVLCLGVHVLYTIGSKSSWRETSETILRQVWRRWPGAAGPYSLAPDHGICWRSPTTPANRRPFAPGLAEITRAGRSEVSPRSTWRVSRRVGSSIYLMVILFLHLITGCRVTCQMHLMWPLNVNRSPSRVSTTPWAPVWTVFLR